MDAISDVSRASQIFSAVPKRYPLPKPLDVDELLGFNEALRRRALDEEVIGQRYLGKSKVFINHVDSFLGKYLVAVLAHKTNAVADVGDGHLPAVGEIREGAENEKVENIKSDKSSKGGRSKGKKDKSPTKTKETKEKPLSPPKGKKKPGKLEISSPDKMGVPLEESLEDIQERETPAYDTSKLTVAEYYEMMDLKTGLERDNYLKDKFKRYQEKLSPPVLCENLKIKNKNRNSRKLVFSDDFEIIGTLKNNEVSGGLVPEGVSKILQNPEENLQFIEHLAECSIIIYNIIEDSDQVIEATIVLNDLQNLLQEIKDTEESNDYNPPLIVLVSSFMTWSLTKPLNPKEPGLPFIEKDYRKRKPHPNYQLHFDLEEQVIKMNGDLETIILVCGIPYGHEENVLHYLFERAFSCLDLPVFNSGNNTVPIIHVENIGEIIREVIKRRNLLKSPFIFAKDPLSFTMKDLVKAISANLGTGCYRTMPSIFSFLKDEITQDIYDQTTADVYLESCYPLFSKTDLNWKYENGFIENIKNIIKEFVDAKQIKPLCILLYGLNYEVESNVVSKLSEHFHIPQLWLNTIVKEYISEMEEKIKIIEAQKAASAVTQRGSLKSQKTQLESKPINGLQECCQENTDLQSSVEFFKKLNLKHLADFKNLSDTQKVSILKQKLSKNPCLNYGFVLVNFPKTELQAQLLFPKENINDIGTENLKEGISKPDFIVLISKPELKEQSVKSVLVDENVKTSFDDASLKKVSVDMELEPSALGERNLSQEKVVTVENITETEVQDGEIKTPKSKPEIQLEIPAVKYFLDNHTNCKLIKMENSKDVDRIFINILKEIEVFSRGDSENLVDLNVVKEDPLNNMEDSEKNYIVEVERNTKTDKEYKSSRFLEERKYKHLKEEEESILAINSCSLIKYLISYVYPTLTNAILETTAVRPEDPLDFIAEYLFVNNPEGHMMDPTEAKEREELLNKPQGTMKIDSKACLA